MRFKVLIVVAALLFAGIACNNDEPAETDTVVDTSPAPTVAGTDSGTGGDAGTGGGGATSSPGETRGPADEGSIYDSTPSPEPEE